MSKLEIKIKERRRMPEPPVEPKVDVEEFVKDVLGKHNFLINPDCYSYVHALVGYKEMFSGVERPMKLTLFIQYDHDTRSIYAILLDGSYQMATKFCQPKQEFRTDLCSIWERISEQNAERYIAAAEKAAEFYCQALQAMDTP